MDELIARLCAESGVDAATAKKAATIVLGFVRREGPAADVDALFAAVPGADAIAPAQAAGGGLGGFFGGGLLAVAGQLAGLGLGFEQMKSVGGALFSFLKEKAGDDVVARVAAGIPGIGQFI